MCRCNILQHLLNTTSGLGRGMHEKYISTYDEYHRFYMCTDEVVTVQFHANDRPTRLSQIDKKYRSMHGYDIF